MYKSELKEDLTNLFTRFWNEELNGRVTLFNGFITEAMAIFKKNETIEKEPDKKE
jgi:hypothetical protein